MIYSVELTWRVTSSVGKQKTKTRMFTVNANTNLKAQSYAMDLMTMDDDSLFYGDTNYIDIADIKVYPVSKELKL